MKNLLFLSLFIFNVYSFSASLKITIEYDDFTGDISKYSLQIQEDNDTYSYPIGLACIKDRPALMTILTRGSIGSQKYENVIVEYKHVEEINTFDEEIYTYEMTALTSNLGSDAIATTNPIVIVFNFYSLFIDTEPGTTLLIRAGNAETQRYTLSENDKVRLREFFAEMKDVAICNLF